MKKLIFVVVFICSSLFLNATHIIGGSLTYKHLGDSTYRIELRLYRDCTNPPGNQVNLQTSAPVDFYYGSSGAFYQRITLTRIHYILIDNNMDSCISDPGLCVQEGLYIDTVILPLISGGYHVYFETCCRNGSVQNIDNSMNEGQAFYCKITDNIFGSNSSPQWKNPSPIFACVGQDINFDHGALDTDGDSLAYSFYTPFSDIKWDDFNAGFHYVTFSGGEPNNLSSVTWLPGFSVNNPLDVTGATNLTVNTNGIINGIPPSIGRFASGIKCDEYRNGVKIGTIYRDFQFNTVNCTYSGGNAGIGPIDICGGLNIQFDNISTGSSYGFLWDFGDNGSTSNLFEPTHNYSTFGTFTVTLIAQYNTPCSDTVTYELTLVDVNADFNSVDSVCLLSTINFSDSSSSSNNNSLASWYWDFGDGFNSTATAPSHSYSAIGNYIVNLIVNSSANCSDSVEKIITVYLPDVDAGNNISYCEGDSALLNATGALQFHWTPTNDLSNDSIANPIVNTINSGWYYVTGSDIYGCTNNDSVYILVNPLPTAPIITYNSLTNQMSSDYGSGNQWYFNGNIITSGGTNQNYLATINGNYWVTYTDNNGCVSVNSNTISITTVGLNEFFMFYGISAHPNPNDGMFTLQSENSRFTNASVEVLDITGKIIYNQTLTENKKTIDISDASAGLYLLRIRIDEEQGTLRIIRQ